MIFMKECRLSAIFDEALIRCINVSLCACSHAQNSNTMMVVGVL